MATASERGSQLLANLTLHAKVYPNKSGNCTTEELGGSERQRSMLKQSVLGAWSDEFKRKLNLHRNTRQKKAHFAASKQLDSFADGFGHMSSHLLSH